MDKDEYGEDELLSKYDQYSDVYVLFVRMAYETRLCQAGWKQILNIRTQIEECINRGEAELCFGQIKVGIKKYSLQDALREEAKHLSIMISSGKEINRAIHGVIESYEDSKFKIQIFGKDGHDFIFIPFDRVKVEEVFQEFANKYATKLKKTQPTATDTDIKRECLRVWYDQNNAISVKYITNDEKDLEDHFYIKGIAFNQRRST